MSERTNESVAAAVSRQGGSPLTNIATKRGLQ